MSKMTRKKYGMMLDEYAWTRYINMQKIDEINVSKRGKWMLFSPDVNFLASLCEEALEKDIVIEAKHTGFNAIENPKYKGNKLACFYLNIDDIERHKKLISFLLQKNLIKKKKNGELYDISFKLDTQTRAGEYSKNFKPQITLKDFIDLKTGEWVLDKKIEEVESHFKELIKNK